MQKQSSNSLDAVIQNSRDSFLIINTGGKITYCNFSSVKAFGYAPNQLLEKQISMLFSKKKYIKIENNILKVCKGVDVANFDTSIEKRTGEKSFFSLNLNAVYNEKLKVIAISMHFRDLSAQRVSERKIRRKAKETVKLKDIFMANLNHELRTPVNLIIGFSDILLQHKIEQEKQQEYLETIKMAAGNLLEVINSMLDSSKIEAGKIVFEKIPFSISKTFLSLEKMFSAKADEKKLEIRFEFHDSIPQLIIGDPTRFVQIISNLISNAIKFTDQGKVLISAKVLVNKNKKKLLQTTVEDTGIGIPKEMHAYLFERYRQAKADTTRNYGGTGLGLSIVKNLVELQKGSINFKSIEGVGSSFTFVLPLLTNTNKIYSKKENVIEDILNNKNKLQALRKLKVLMIEDNILNIKMMVHIFLMQKISLEIAVNGMEGIEKVKNNHFDIILMDIEMPVMKGCETTQIIRKELKNNIPIIALTANALSGEKEKYLKKGMNGFISKPVNTNLLFTSMYQLTSPEVLLQ
tara:strand:+ start:10301 stop:11860 length:1560 start_codon:yes stop_codon:yes gene_type:complete